MRVWLVALLLLFVALFFHQCSQTQKAKTRLAETERIADQNLKAMGDSTVQLKLTRKQLAYADSALAVKVYEADSLVKALGSKKDKVREVIVVKPVVVAKDVDVVNTVKRDPTDSTKYNLDFAVNDSVKSFTGTSSFFVRNGDGSISIFADSTKIRDFKLNFHFSVVKYDDAALKVTRYKIIPYYTDSTGKEYLLSENQLKFDFRGVELLDKPWQENIPGPIGSKPKNRLTGKWGLGINPIGVAPVIRNGTLKLGYTPSISFGYFLTFMKR